MNKSYIKKVLILVVILLIVIGIVSVNSARLPQYILKNERQSHIFYRTISNLIFALFLSFSVYFVPKLFIHKKKWFDIMLYSIIGFCAFLLIIPRFISHPINGAYRWISILGFKIQPSELVKPIFIVIIAYFIYKYQENQNKMMMYNFIAVTFLFTLCIFLEKSNSSAIQYILIVFLVFLVSKCNVYIKMVISCGVIILGSFGIFVLYLLQNYAWKRIYDFFTNPPTQVKAAIFATQLGGLKGRGIGEGLQKYFYLSEAHTDYIFSAISEEIGFLGSLVILLIFSLLIAIMVYIVMSLKNEFNRFIVFGVIFNITNQFLLHVAINLSILPSTGIILPFISYGGSALASNLMCIGLLIYAIDNENVVEWER